MSEIHAPLQKRDLFWWRRRFRLRIAIFLQVLKERLYRSIIAGLAFSAVLLFGQNSPADRAKLAAGQQSFESRCAGCHGADAHGSDRAPGLAGNRRVRSRSADQLRAYIRRGVPASGMPAF